MPIKYVPTPDDPEELRREEDANARYWQAQAELAMADDPEFALWKKNHQRKYWLLTVLAFAASAAIFWPLFYDSRRELKALATPFFVAAFVWGTGRWKFNRRCQEIGLEHWDRLREKEKKPNQASQPTPVNRRG